MLLFGSIWGLIEVFGGNFFYDNELPFSSILLAVFAFLMLAIARGIVNIPISSTLIALFACFFKLANTAPFYCHLLGIFTLGVTFDVFATIFLGNEKKLTYKPLLVGLLSAYIGNILFAFVITYIVRYQFWISEGFTKVLNHIIVNGSITAIAAALLTPLGLWIGMQSRALEARNPRLIYTCAALCLMISWALGRASG